MLRESASGIEITHDNDSGEPLPSHGELPLKDEKSLPFPDEGEVEFAPIYGSVRKVITQVIQTFNGQRHVWMHPRKKIIRPAFNFRGTDLTFPESYPFGGSADYTCGLAIDLCIRNWIDDFRGSNGRIDHCWVRIIDSFSSSRIRLTNSVRIYRLSDLINEFAQTKDARAHILNLMALLSPDYKTSSWEDYIFEFMDDLLVRFDYENLDTTDEGSITKFWVRGYILESTPPVDARYTAYNIYTIHNSFDIGLLLKRFADLKPMPASEHGEVLSFYKDTRRNASVRFGGLNGKEVKKMEFYEQLIYFAQGHRGYRDGQ